MIGKIQKVPLREVWKHEESGFTRWLQDNIDILSEQIGLPLSNVERERSAGDFNVDLTAEDQDGNLVIIENQLEKSDHDHLGKLITYLVAIDAKVAVWIVAHPRPEHQAAILWLNETSTASFYLLKVETIRIDDSPAAPRLTLIVGPSEEGREVGKTKQNLAERHGIRHRFWAALLEKAKEKTKLHANISPCEDNWIITGAGKSGLGFVYSITQHTTTVSLAIDRSSSGENKTIFNMFAESRQEIERVFGDSLEWSQIDNRSVCYIHKQFTLGGWRDESKWPEIQNAMIDAMIHLEKALRPYIDKLQI